ncbi:MAG: oxidoreductase [Rhodobacterales bacterium]|nr:MAG: oxidoreductase [Rhodobacterales bacterium]
MNSQSHLFTPLEIGGMTVKNRILSTGHDTTLPTDDRVNAELIAYHAARAAGGVGLIVSQVVGVHETARYTNHVLMAVEDGCIPGFRDLAQAVQAHDARLVVQLFHPGREIMESADGTLPVAYAPSAVPSDRFHTIPREMSGAMVEEIIAGYGAAARRMADAGVDGVEIVASHGYLPAQFLSPQTNLRSDKWGGSEENRLAFLRAILDAARKGGGEGFVVGLRISGNEYVEGGMDDSATLSAIRALAPKLDYVNVIAGTSATLGGAIHIVPPMFQGTAYLAPFAAQVKAAVEVPVLVAGRINQPQEAEAVIASGQADMCGMTRALICDPDMPHKAAAARFDDIRACIGCNQACIGHFHKGVPISCIQYPESGRELIFGTLPKTDMPRRVMVVGAGPGGLKAAATAARRGHHVALHDAAAQPGGQARLAQLLPGRAEFGGIITNLVREAELAGVEIQLNSRVTRAMIDADRPDAVIIATGATVRLPDDLETEDAAHVVQAVDVLQGKADPGSRVVIADWRADWVGLGLAERLAAAGHHVRLAVNAPHAGEALQSYVRDSMVARIHALGVEVIPYARLYGADGDSVYLIHQASGEPMVLEDVDTLVLAQGGRAQDDLIRELENWDGQVVAIGDCLAPRTAEEAVLEGLRAGCAV